MREYKWNVWKFYEKRNGVYMDNRNMNQNNNGHGGPGGHGPGGPGQGGPGTPNPKKVNFVLLFG